MPRHGAWRREFPAPIFALQDELNRLFDEFVRPPQPSAPSGPTVGMEGAHWTPSVNLFESPGEFLIQVDLPGVDPATIELLVTGDLLTLKGERPVLSPPEAQPMARECPAGAFHRQVRLPGEVDVEAIQAESRHGQLAIRLPKRSAVQPRTIKITPS